MLNRQLVVGISGLRSLGITLGAARAAIRSISGDEAASNVQGKQQGADHSQFALSQGPRRLAQWLSGVIAFAGEGGGSSAHAHVKWFAEYDLNKPPLPVGEVFTAQFIYFFVGVRGHDLRVFRIRSLRLPLAHIWKRAATLHRHRAGGILDHALGGVHFFHSSQCLRLFRSPFYLTPELKTDHRWVPFVQLGDRLSRDSSGERFPWSAWALASLFIAAVTQYGIFHLLDYLILVGSRTSFLAAAMRSPGWLWPATSCCTRRPGLHCLGCDRKMGLSVWTFPLLARDPDLLMGFTRAPIWCWLASSSST